MSIPDAQHPIWSVTRLAIVAVVLCVMLAVGYKNGFDFEKDGRTILIVLGSIGAFDVFKSKITKDQP